MTKTKYNNYYHYYYMNFGHANCNEKNWPGKFDILINMIHIIICILNIIVFTIIKYINKKTRRKLKNKYYYHQRKNKDLKKNNKPQAPG